MTQHRQQAPSLPAQSAVHRLELSTSTAVTALSEFSIALKLFTMALNWTMLDAKRKPVPINDEIVVKSIESGVEVFLNIPDAPPTSSSASAGGSGGSRKVKAQGSLWLTDHRVRSQKTIHY